MIQSSRTTLYIAAAATATAILPTVLLFVLPLVRPATKRVHRERKLPDGVERRFTPKDGLELLVAKHQEGSESESESRAPILLLHGGFGSALCYVKWLPYLASKGRDVYSLSLSGHGLSPRPKNFVTMSVGDFAPDLRNTLAYIHSLHSSAPLPVLVGHSAGGGLSQYTLANSPSSGPTTSGLVLVDAYPPTGGWSVYLNWLSLDPLFGLRMIYQLGDTKSALSTPRLVRNAFFGSKMRGEELDVFYADMTPEESIVWPQSMMFSFVDPADAKKGASGRVAVLAGDEDVLMTPKIMKGVAEKYEAPLTLVPSGGHHLPRDEVWREGADALIAQLSAWSL